MPDRTTELAGRVAVVTGGGSRVPKGIGNGRAAAVLLARDGARVAVVDQVPEWSQETVDMITAEGGEAIAVVADVADEASVAACVTRVHEEWDAVDILVNNVGVSTPAGNATALDIARFEAATRINVASMIMMSRYCLPSMRRRGGGSIITIASEAGLIGGHPNLSYSTTKGAVVNLTKAMAVDHGHDGIRVNCVVPGVVYTPMVFSRGMTPEMREQRRRQTLLQVEGTGWDVGEAVRFFAGDRSRSITGVVLPVDAGTLASFGAEDGTENAS